MPNNKRPSVTLGVFCLMMAWHCQAAPPLVVKSSSTQTQLLELYTSEGCSSCPPADHWLSQLTHDQQLWKTFVPVAFHVTYWNYLGWRDPFAQSQFDRRQRQQAATAGSGVYTPGMFLDGAEYRRWRTHRGVAANGKLQGNQSKQVGVLEATLNNATVQTNFAALAHYKKLNIEVALLANGLTTQVRAGENKGKMLTHNFVVTTFEQHPMTQNGGVWTADVQLPTTATADAHALAIWVSQDNGMPVQSTGGWL